MPLVEVHDTCDHAGYPLRLELGLVWVQITLECLGLHVEKDGAVV